ncbi:MAG: cyclic nucleotide-binding domain-containing protein [Gammaproteobacteria bacterium]|nr:cyclic nucleotide-binding domain-containing protein [Gammaproteobacteria bacterium]
MIEKNELDREKLQRLEPLSELSPERIDELMDLAYVEQFGLGMSLFREGEIDNQTLYLISGDVQLNSADGRIDMLLKHDADQARFPLDDSQPRQSTCVAMTLVQILRIENSILDYMMVWDQMAVSEVLEQKEEEVEKLPEQSEQEKSEHVQPDNQEKVVQENVREKNIAEESSTKPEKVVSETDVNQNSESPAVEEQGSEAQAEHAQTDKNIDSTVTEPVATKAVELKSEPELETEAKSVAEGVYIPDRAWIRKMRHIMAFKSMPPANIKYLLELMEPIDVKAGEEIVKQGDAGDFFYVLVDGQAKVTRTIELANLEAGQSFGEEALLSGSKRNASVSMTEPGVVMRLAKKDFDAMLKDPLLNRVSPDEARKKVTGGARWIDIRHVTEFNHGHLKDAINIPLHELRLRRAELDKSQEYICYCRTGHRSSAATFLLAQSGFNVSVLSGGVQVMAQDLKTAQ